jgi:hypothetical protein
MSAKDQLDTRTVHTGSTQTHGTSTRDQHRYKNWTEETIGFYEILPYITHIYYLDHMTLLNNVFSCWDSCFIYTLEALNFSESEFTRKLAHEQKVNLGKDYNEMATLQRISTTQSPFINNNCSLLKTIYTIIIVMTRTTNDPSL